MYPVYTYFKELENTWEYAAIGGDDMGQVAFYTGLFSDGDHAVAKRRAYL